MEQFKYFLFGSVITVLATLLLVEKGYYKNSTNYINPTKTDTIHTNTVYKEVIIQPKEIAIPYEVKVYRVDTVFREKLENDTLISSVVITPKEVKIHTLTPSGLPLINTYPIKDFNQITIAHDGQTSIKLPKHPKRKKTLKILSKIGLFVGGVATYKYLSK